MSNLLDLSLKDYSLLLASKAPAPGGGAASALSGAQGIALTLMVINLTIGKEKYSTFEPLCLEIKPKAEELLKDLLDGIEKDKNVFTELSEAYKLPKNTDVEKALRSQAIAQATIGATKVPIETIEQGVEGLKMTVALLEKSNKGAVSDLGVSAVNLLSCVKGAWLNVEINLQGIKDPKMAREFEEKGVTLIKEAESLSLEIYNKTIEIIKS